MIDPDEPLAAIGSGGSYATAAARALMENTDLSAREIAEKAMKIAGEICIYTNDHITIRGVEELAENLPRASLHSWPFIYPHPPKNKISRSTS